MKKSDLISIVSEKCGLPKAQTKKVVNCIIETITSAVTNGENVMLFGFGSFRRVLHNEKRTVVFGKKMVIPEHYTISFVTGRSIKIALAEKLLTTKTKSK